MSGKFTSRMLNYFFQGLLFLAPLSITVWAIIKLFTWINGWLQGYIDYYLGFTIPGLGLIILLVLITIIGFLGSTIILRPFLNYFDKLLAKAPLIKILYTAVKDLVSAFVGKKKRFTEPVLIKMNKDSAIERIGFITNHDLSAIGQSNEKVAVYLPHSYAWSGNLFIVPVEYITPLKASTTDVMKFIISAGVTNID